MPEYTDEETFLRLVTAELAKSGIEIDEPTGTITGDLSDVVRSSTPTTGTGRSCSGTDDPRLSMRL